MYEFRGYVNSQLLLKGTAKTREGLVLKIRELKCKDVLIKVYKNGIWVNTIKL